MTDRRKPSSRNSSEGHPSRPRSTDAGRTRREPAKQGDPATRRTTASSGASTKRTASSKRTAPSKGQGSQRTDKKRPAAAKGSKRPAAAQPAKSRKRYVDVKKPTERRYRRTARVELGNQGLRLRVFIVVIALLLGTASVRAFQLQALDPQAMAQEAAAKMQTSRDEPANRGAITDRNGVVLAETEPGVMIFVDPDMIQTNGADKRYPMSANKQEEAAAAPEAVAEILVKHLGGTKDEYLEVFDRKNEETGKRSRYEVIARRVPAHTFTQIQDDLAKGIEGDGSRPWYGVFSESDPIRFYPNRTTAANVVGFVNGEGVGAGGLEYALEENLAGENGTTTFDRSTYGRIPLGTNIMIPAEDGLNYELTIDSDLQWMTDQMLAEGIQNAGASTGMAVAMDVNTGEVLALSALPTYDSSNPGASDSDDLGNRAVTQAYEPGSTQKVLTMAALADQSLVTPDTRVQVPAKIASGGGYVRDSYEHGTINLTARGIMANSSNIGTIQLARQMDKALLSEYLQDFGLGDRTGIGLPGETAGSVPEVDMADYTRDQIAFGQGLSVNAVQMASAMAAVVNGGTYHEPKIIRSATDADGASVDLPQTESREVISEEASRSVVEMMEAVTLLDADARSIPGYRTAGKSGTAQRFDADCMCYNGFTASYVGVAPAEDPQILVYVVLDEPTNGNLGSQLALPVVNQILQLALPRYNVLPSTTEAEEKPLTFE